MEQLKNLKNKPKSTFLCILSEYLCRSQVQGYNLIMLNDRPLHERFFWTVVTIFGITLTFWLVINSYLDFLDSPTVTSEDPTHISVLELPFPAISLCTANRISRKALIKYSKFILNATKDDAVHIGRTVEDIFQNLLRMGLIYTMELMTDDFYTLEKVHNVLRNVYGGGVYPFYTILREVAPSCNDLLKECKWQGHSVPCSEIFHMRRSFMGPCCSFNYHRPSASLMIAQQKFNQTLPRFEKPYKVHSHGTDFGLAVLIDHNLDDYAFTMDSYIGVNVLIHDTYHFPDQTSGSVNEKIISPEEEVFLTLRPYLVRGSNSMKSFTIKSRNCVFDDEINLLFNKLKQFYNFPFNSFLTKLQLTQLLQFERMSFNMPNEQNHFAIWEMKSLIHNSGRLGNCTVTVHSFCGCQLPHISNLFNASTCMLNDMPCLNRWRSGWHNFEPLATNVDRAILINDVHCPECVTRCNRIKYQVKMSESNFDINQMKKRFNYPEFNYSNVTDVSNHSILHVNFGTNKVKIFYQSAQYVWYELLANLGSVACLSLGATMVSIIEIIYFFSGKFGAMWRTEKVEDVPTSQFDYVN